MKETAVLSKEYKFFQVILFLYPTVYRKKFGQEMLILFDDMYREKIQKDGKIGIIFWFSLIFDSLLSAIEQHRLLAKKQGMKKYIHKTLSINIYNIIGSILLLPFFAVFLVDFFARLAQGDLTHYNRPVYAYLSHSFFYQTPILFIWVILFPIVAVLLNLMPVLQNIKRKKGSLFLAAFIKQNVISLSLLLIGLGFLVIIKFHDFAPCMVHGILKIGIGQLPHIISVCENA